MYTRIREDVDKTNNYAEAAHRRCKQQLNMAHPGIWCFLAALQSVQRVLDYDYHQHTAANAPQRKRKLACRSRLSVCDTSLNSSRTAHPSTTCVE
ncbi:hypothetical protein AAVH_37378 [Aphelenchoides avenae]|nr:hypothetical protein AAVH_37378 [Aphelenchus avenae]